jgi:hypothetical protein
MSDQLHDVDVTNVDGLPDWSGLNGFLYHHLLCGRSTWPEGREPTPAEVPHLTVSHDVFETFVEVTWRCRVCQAAETITINDVEEWRRFVARLHHH